FRKLWIARINARARTFGMSYSSFIHGLKGTGVAINRKFLSDIATNDELAFEKLVQMINKKA
ncbi:MAG: 50S ribosomal protein L20, partial [Spirochaetes bacterium]|nr:50S ribosomal protein L20 [Spirochaetota bacterium]